MRTTIYVCRGSSTEYPQSMFLSRNKKNNVYTCKPQFYSIKVGFKEVKLYRLVFVIKALFNQTLLICFLFLRKIYVVGTFDRKSVESNKKKKKKKKKTLIRSTSLRCFIRVPATSVFLEK